MVLLDAEVIFGSLQGLAPDSELGTLLEHLRNSEVFEIEPM